jgi:cell division protein ZapA (FtsZ GTPase activity inhibitor)
MLIKEMQEYTEGLNVDRLVSFTALVAFMRIQQSNSRLCKKNHYG